MAGRILIVDDERLSRRVLCDELSNEGYEIREVADGEEALEVLAGETFDLVITDFIMPHMDGFRLLGRIKDKWRQLPVILITGYLSAYGGSIILEGKAAAVFHKPINLNDVVLAVKRIVEPTT